MEVKFRKMFDDHAPLRGFVLVTVHGFSQTISFTPCLHPLNARKTFRCLFF